MNVKNRPIIVARIVKALKHLINKIDRCQLCIHTNLRIYTSQQLEVENNPKKFQIVYLLIDFS